MKCFTDSAENSYEKFRPNEFGQFHLSDMLVHNKAQSASDPAATVSCILHAYPQMSMKFDTGNFH
jgi:hypothetical protein